LIVVFVVGVFFVLSCFRGGVFLRVFVAKEKGRRSLDRRPSLSF